MGNSKRTALIMSDSHIVKDKKTGAYYCKTAVHGYEFWSRYLAVFDEIYVISRVQEDEIQPSNYVLASGDRVTFVDLPFLRGAKKYLLNYFKLKKIFREISKLPVDCGIFRLPSFPTFMLLKEFQKTKKPYALEIVADPESAYKDNKLALAVLSSKLKKECLKANGVSYVTRYFLQKKYPSYSLKFKSDRTHFDSFYSSINLDADFFSPARSYRNLNKRTFKIIHVCSAINSDIKGHTTLLKTIKLLLEEGINVSLTCIGDGDRRNFYVELAHQYGISRKVEFLGLFSSKDVLKKYLLEHDLMLFPSQAEGLPRVLIEAMATGLPCLSTPVNGIPELLEHKYLFDPFDSFGFSRKIVELINNPVELEEMSRKNVKKAEEYKNDILQKRRNEFFEKLINVKGV